MKLEVYVKSDKSFNTKDLTWYKEVDKETKRQNTFAGEGVEVLIKHREYKLKEVLKTLKELLKEVDLTPEEWLYYNLSRGIVTEVEPCIYKIEVEVDEVLPNFVKVETEGLNYPLTTSIMYYGQKFYIKQKEYNVGCNLTKQPNPKAPVKVGFTTEKQLMIDLVVMKQFKEEQPSLVTITSEESFRQPSEWIGEEVEVKDGLVIYKKKTLALKPEALEDGVYKVIDFGLDYNTNKHTNWLKKVG